MTSFAFASRIVQVGPIIITFPGGAVDLVEGVGPIVETVGIRLLIGRVEQGTLNRIGDEQIVAAGVVQFGPVVSPGCGEGMHALDKRGPVVESVGVLLLIRRVEQGAVDRIGIERVVVGRVVQPILARYFVLSALTL